MNPDTRSNCTRKYIFPKRGKQPEPAQRIGRTNRAAFPRYEQACISLNDSSRITVQVHIRRIYCSNCNKLNNERGKNDLKPRVQPSSASRTQVRTRRFFFVLRKKIKKNGQQPKNQQLENQSCGTAEQNARPVRSFRKCRKHSKSNTHHTRQCISQCRSNAFLLHFAPLSYRL